MTHFKALLLSLALFSFLIPSFAQNGFDANTFVPTDTSNGYLFAAESSYGVKAGIGYVQNGDFSFCLGGRYRTPIGDVTDNNKRFVAEVEAGLDLRSFSSENSSFNQTRLMLTPGIKRICSFDEKVNMGGGISLPINFGSNTNKFDGQISREDNVIGAGVRFDYEVNFQLNDDSFIGVNTSLAGLNWTRFSSKDNPDISSSSTTAWFGFNKNNSLSVSYNKILGGGLSR